MELTDATNEIAKVKSDMVASNNELSRLRGELATETSVHESTRQALEETMNELGAIRETLRLTTIDLERERMVSSHLRMAEQLLHGRCEQLMEHIKTMTSQLGKVQEKLENCRELGKDQASLLVELSVYGNELTHCMERQIAQWGQEWTTVSEDIIKNVMNANKELGMKSKEKLGYMFNIVEKSVHEHCMEIITLIGSFKISVEQIDQRINECIGNQFKGSECNAEVLLKSVERNVDAVQLKLGVVQNLVSSFSEDYSMILNRNKKTVEDFISTMQQRLGTVGASLDNGLTDNSAVLSRLMERLFEFELKQSEALTNSVDAMKHQLNDLLKSQQNSIRAEILDLRGVCQSSKQLIELLKTKSGEDMNERLPSELLTFKDEIVSSMTQ